MDNMGQLQFSKEFIQLSLDLLCAVSAEGHIIEVNPRVTECLGWNAKDLVQKPVKEWLHLEDQVSFLQALQLVRDQNQPASFTNRFRRQDGSYSFLAWRMSFSVEKQMYFCLLTDVTTLHDQYSAQYVRLASIFDQSPCGFFMMGLDGRCSYANRFWEELSGLTLSETVGLGWSKAMHPDEVDSIGAYVQSYLNGEIPTYFLQHRVVNTRTGDISFVASRIIPILSESGEIEEYMGIMQDETARVKQGQEIENQRAKLINAAKLSALGEMAGGIAHEINNPLAVIQGKVSRIQSLSDSGRLTPEILKLELEKVGTTAQRIARIVRGLRMFARDGSQDEFRSSSIKTIAEEAIGLCVERFRNSGVELDFQFHLVSGVSDHIQCRSVQLGQVMVNLLNNSFDAIGDKPNPWVKFEVFANTDGAKIVVTDSGLGIPADVREKMMLPFFTTKEIGKGTGLGLSISRGIVEAHGGKLWIDEACANTRFVIELPVKQSASSLPEKPSSAA